MKVRLLVPILFLSFSALMPIYSSPVFSHLDPVESKKEYEITLELNSISIDQDPNWYTANDQNFLGDADVVLDYTITPTDPEHDKAEGLTKNPVEIGSGESVTFTEPINVFSHTTCSCRQELESEISALDYTPVKSLVYAGFKKGLSLTGSYVTTGPMGVAMDLLGEGITWVMNQITVSNLTDEERERFDAAVIKAEESEFIGQMKDTQSINCEDGQFTQDLTNEEQRAGEITYTIKATETGNTCPEEVTSDPGVTEDGDSASADGTDGTSEEEDELECEAATGKVKIDGEFVCPINSVAAGESCACRKGYEWAFLDNLCEGCQKTSTEKCLEAVRLITDDAAGYLEPEVSVYDENKIRWDAGIVSCKHLSSVMTDFSANIEEVLPDNIAECTNLEFLGAQEYEGCGINFNFRFIKDE